jgi:hypothetical protein
MNEGSAESQVFFTLAFFAFRFTVGLACGLHGELGLLIGFDKVLSLGFVAYASYAVSLYIGLATKTVLPVMICTILLGIFTPMMPVMNICLSHYFIERSVYLSVAHKLNVFFDLGVLVSVVVFAIVMEMGGLQPCMVMGALVPLIGLVRVVKGLPSMSVFHVFKWQNVLPWSGVMHLSNETQYCKFLWYQWLATMMWFASVVAVLPNFFVEVMGLSPTFLAIYFALLTSISALITAILPVFYRLESLFFFLWPCYLTATVGLMTGHVAFVLLTGVLVCFAGPPSVALAALYFSFAPAARYNDFVAGYKFAQGLPFCAGLLVGGLFFSFILSSPVMLETFPGIAFLPSLVFGFMGLALHMYAESRFSWQKQVVANATL